MKKLYFIFAIIIFPLFATAQQGISVLTFEQLPMDLSARDYPQIDMSNGKLAALIKIETTQTGFDFDVGQLGIVKVEYKTAEIWVYVPEKAKSIRIAHPVLGQLPDRFYFFPVPIVSAAVYRMVLVTGIVETTVKQPEKHYQYLIINTTPDGADVFINDIASGQTPFKVEVELGKYTWRISKTGYLPDAGIVELKTPDGKERIDLTLKPNYGVITFVTTPEAGADLFINEMTTGKQTPATINVPAGEQIIEVRKNMYKPSIKRMTFTAGETRTVEINMEPTFNIVTIKTEPKAEIYINTILKGTGEVTERLNIGVHTVEAKLKNHNTVTEKVSVSLGEPVIKTLKLTPKTGTLKIDSSPFDATVKINGVEKGTTPLTLRNLIIGDYEIEVSKKDFASVKRTVTVEEGKEKFEDINLDTPENVEINDLKRRLNLAKEKQRKSLIYGYSLHVAGIGCLITGIGMYPKFKPPDKYSVDYQYYDDYINYKNRYDKRKTASIILISAGSVFELTALIITPFMIKNSKTVNSLKKEMKTKYPHVTLQPIIIPSNNHYYGMYGMKMGIIF